MCLIYTSSPLNCVLIRRKHLLCSYCMIRSVAARHRLKRLYTEFWSIYRLFCKTVCLFTRKAFRWNVTFRRFSERWWMRWRCFGLSHLQFWGWKEDSSPESWRLVPNSPHGELAQKNFIGIVDENLAWQRIFHHVSAPCLKVYTKTRWWRQRFSRLPTSIQNPCCVYIAVKRLGYISLNHYCIWDM